MHNFDAIDNWRQFAAIESSRKQMFFAEHIPSLTEMNIKDGNTQQIAEFIECMLFASLGITAE